jgi:tetratricopeptide (TPR) repeat protein
VARKSFSKLRGAIAGLYAARGMHVLAERAFREARALYVVSPEANLRLAQEVLLPFRRFDEAYGLLKDLHDADPNNTRLPDILKHISGARETDRRMGELMEKRKAQGGLTHDETLELARCYVGMGRPDVVPTFLDAAVASGSMTAQQLFEAAQLYQSAKRDKEGSAALQRIPDAELGRDAFPSEVLLAMASIHAGAGNFEAVVKVLVRHLKREPSDYQAWLDLATMNLRLRRPEQAAAALQQAIRIGGQNAISLMQRSPELQAFQDELMARGPAGPRLPAPR